MLLLWDLDKVVLSERLNVAFVTHLIGIFTRIEGRWGLELRFIEPLRE